MAIERSGKLSPLSRGNYTSSIDIELMVWDLSRLCSHGDADGILSDMVTPTWTDSDSARADYGAKLKSGHRLATGLCMV